MKSVKFIYILLLMFAVSSCFNELEDPSVQPADSVISLDISTLAVNGASDPNSSEMENVIKSAFVFIFNDRGVLENPGNTYVTEKTSNGEVIDNGKTLNAKWNVTTGAKEIYVVANASDKLATTLTDLSSKNGLSSTVLDTLSLRPPHSGNINDYGDYLPEVYNIPSNGMLMTGKASAAAVSGGSTTVPVTVTRKSARIDCSMRKAKDLEGSEVVVKDVRVDGIEFVTVLFKDDFCNYIIPVGLALSKTIDKQQSVAGQASTNPSDYTPLRSVYTYNTKYKKGDRLATITFSVDGVDKSIEIPATEDITLKGNTVLRVLATLSRGSVDAALDILDWKDAEVNGDIYGNEFKVSKSKVTLFNYGTRSKDTVKVSALDNVEFLYYEYNGKKGDASILPDFITIDGVQELDGNRNTGELHFAVKKEAVASDLYMWVRSGNIRKRIKILVGEAVIKMASSDGIVTNYLGGEYETYVDSYIKFVDHTEPLEWKFTDFSDRIGPIWRHFSSVSWIPEVTKSGPGGENDKFVIKTEFQNEPTNLDDARLRDYRPYSFVYNLSNQTTGGNEIENTANCYIVSRPGSYMFPLVYGNAIKNGEENKSAYQRDSSQSDRYLQSLIKHDGTPITSSRIVDKSTKLPISASVLWMEYPGLIDQVEVVNVGTEQFIKFRVEEKTIRQGNAVIVLKDATGQILWSWHIWFSYVAMNYLNKKDQTIHKRSTNGKEYTFLKCPLGWVSWKYISSNGYRVHIEQKETGLGTYFGIKYNTQYFLGHCTYYERGRKDPFPNNQRIICVDGKYSSAPSSLKEEFYNDSNLPQTNNDVERAIASLAYGIQHPDQHNGIDITSSEPLFTNLWNINLSHFGDPNKVPRVKTVYDPCPVGYRVMDPLGASCFSDAVVHRMYNGDTRVQPYAELSGTRYYLAPHKGTYNLGTDFLLAGSSLKGAMRIDTIGVTSNKSADALDGLIIPQWDE